MDDKPHRKPSPSRAKRRPIALRGRPHSTRQVAGWFGVHVDEVRRWVHEKAYFSDGRYWVVLDQMVGVHRRGRPWRFYMRRRRDGTSRPPNARR